MDVKMQQRAQGAEHVVTAVAEQRRALGDLELEPLGREPVGSAANSNVHETRSADE